MKIRKPIIAFLILLFLSLTMAVITFFFNFVQSQENADYRNNLIAQNAVESLKVLEKDINQVYDSTKQKTIAGVNLTVSVLKRLSKRELSSSLHSFEDGIVVQIKGEEVLYPQDYSWRFDNLNAEYLQKEPTLQFQFMRNGETGEEQYTAVTARKIMDDYWYIDWLSEAEYWEMLENQHEIFSIIKDLQEAFDGYIFLFDTQTPDLDITYAPPAYQDVSTAADIGLTKEMIQNKTPVFGLESRSFSAHYTSLHLFQTQMLALILINSTNAVINIASNTGLILLLVLITVMAVVMWLYWIQTYVRDHELTENQKKGYHPGQIRRITRSIGVIGVIFFFIIAAALEAFSSLSLESAKNNKTLNLMESRMDANTSMTSRYREDEESWYIYYAQRLAWLLSNYPDLQPRTFLAEANDLLDCEYIVLFDGNGKEILSSNSYFGLDLMKDLVRDGDDFRKLLQGVPKVIHDPEPDLLEGQTVQLIGAPIINKDEGISGAVIIAIDPEKSWLAAEKEDYSNFLNIITPTGNLSLVVDNEDGMILYTNEKQLEGKEAKESGLYESNAPNTELDSFSIRADQFIVNTYGAYQKDEHYQYYFMTFADVFQNNALPFGLGSAICFLLVYWIVTAFMLRPYRVEIYNETVRITSSALQDSLLDGSGSSEWLKLQNEEEPPEDLREHWKKLLPERKTSIFIEIILVMILAVSVAGLLSGRSELTRSAIRFVLMGTWHRGLNLLSLAGIMILVISYTILVFCKKLILNLIGNVLDRKAETVFRLIFSFIQYASLIALLYFAFNFLGFDTRTLLASVSVLSLAVTLGAKDLVADILAGIFIIFEDDFHVGDIIEVNGFSGIVQEIGVRSTKLIGIGDNIKIIGNESVKNVLNMSKMNSWYSLDLKVPSDQPLKEIEAMLELELPRVGETIPEIISGPYYKGVMAIGNVHTLYIIAECKQSNYRKVQRELNHSILGLFEEHGYKIC